MRRSRRTDLAQVLVDRATDGIVLLDEHGIVAFANRASEALVGGATLAGRPVTDLADPEHRSLLLRMIATASSDDAIEFRLAGGERWAEASVSDLRGDDAVGGFVLVVRDVTERRRLTDDVTRAYLVEREAAARARVLEDARADLLAAVSHDFRTPLTSILGFGQMLRGHWARFDDHSRLDMVARIICAAEELDRRVTDFLDIARPDATLPGVRDEPLAMAELVDAALARLQLALAGHVIRVAVDPEVRALGDDAATGRILENLLSNAAKYAPAGTPISITVCRDGDRVVLTVTDEGPGIAAGDRERVFDRFVRLGDRSRARGAGIGLAVVRQLVEAQRGTVSVEAGPNGGSAFVVVLRAALTSKVSA